MVVSPSGDSYAAATAATSKVKSPPKMKREEFPVLKTSNIPIPTRCAASVKSRLGSKQNKSAQGVKQKAAAAKSMNKARSAKVGPRFEVTRGFEGWTEVRKSVEQKLPTQRSGQLRPRTVAWCFSPRMMTPRLLYAAPPTWLKEHPDCRG